MKSPGSATRSLRGCFVSTILQRQWESRIIEIGLVGVLAGHNLGSRSNPCLPSGCQACLIVLCHYPLDPARAINEPAHKSRLGSALSFLKDTQVFVLSPKFPPPKAPPLTRFKLLRAGLLVKLFLSQTFSQQQRSSSSPQILLGLPFHKVKQATRPD